MPRPTVATEKATNPDDIIFEKEECIICFEDFDEENDFKRKIVFNHCTLVNIHFQCLKNWIRENNNSCIVCREPINTPFMDNMITIVYNEDIESQINEIELYHQSQCKTKHILYCLILILIIAGCLPLM